MKQLPTVVLVLTGLLAGTACQPIPPKPENVSVEAGSLAGTQLDPNVLRLKEQLSLTEQQTNQLNEIFQDTNAQQQAINVQRTALRKQMMELQKKNREQINGVLTPEQAKKYEQILSGSPPEVEAQPSSEPQPPQPAE